MQDLGKLTDFLIEVEQLKKTMRFSTCPEGVGDSSAEHSWKLGFMVSALDRDVTGVDNYHAYKIAAVHDLAEYITEDIDSYRIVLGKITKEQKHQMEETAMRSIIDKVPAIGQELYDLWQEFEESKTPEARYVKALDKIEALIHLLHVDYIAREDGAEAELTATYADKAVGQFPQLRPLLDVVKPRLKAMFEKRGMAWKPSYDLPPVQTG